MRIKLNRRSHPDSAPITRVGAVADTIRPMIRYVCRMPDGTLLIRTKEWKRPATKEAIAEWMSNYAESLESGYKPAGFDIAPMPFYARVMLRREVLAEWRMK